MGRLVTYIDEVANELDLIFKSKNPHVGLIIGQTTPQKDFVIRLCPTPHQEEKTSTAKENENEEKKASKKGKRSKKTSPGKDFDLDEQWICQHAKQAIRTLPGGLDILGLYIAATPEFVSNFQPKLRQILFSVYKTLSKSKTFAVNEADERILLHICTVSCKFVCRTYDVSNYMNSANPADFKSFTGVSQWHKLECQLAIDLKFPIQQVHSAYNLQRQIEMGLTQFFKDVKNAVILIDGSLRKPQESLDASLDVKKSKYKEKSSNSPLCCKADLYLPLDGNDSSVEDAELLDCVTMMTFKGTIQCRAFVHSRATVKEAIQALKQDVIRTITSRCEIHCEDLLLIDGEQQDPVVVHELPRRVFAPLPQGDICVSDYQFHGDSAIDSLDAFKELLNLKLTEQDVDTSCETCPTTSALIQTEVMEDRLSEFGDNSASNHSTVFQVAGATIAVLAAGISYLLLLQDN